MKQAPLVYKMTLKGRVRDNELSTSSYSWPAGATLTDATKLIDSFARAFELVSVELSCNP